ncbi:flagellar associated protein [Monoraphidium neglectum]|uniref:Flagellar associated protein n=1 Tax=Monoraphidium neglectum TaxID=145388 RepID=A0A0D2JXT9_9CHLO|nr:flagellar associated protein [Monoraphidium neglectum]KIZ03448.1 flagellar associated protein [Monoraphidium neglectum]|eukprot:XP_013902467.1 flagellar associated protein [Monoraphidium neglectum]
MAQAQRDAPECALVLQTQVAPAVIGKVGDPQSGRITRASVDAYLQSHHLVFDRGLLAQMFDEADFRREGSLAPSAFVAAVEGRYPKRRFTRQWRELVSLLLGVACLRLLDVDTEPVTEEQLAVNRKVGAGVLLWLMDCCSCCM